MLSRKGSPAKHRSVSSVVAQLHYCTYVPIRATGSQREISSVIIKLLRATSAMHHAVTAELAATAVYTCTVDAALREPMG